MGVSALLGCMSMSMIYINTSDDERLFKQLNYFSPPLLLLFFVRSGLNFDLGAIFSSSDHIGSALCWLSVWSTLSQEYSANTAAPSWVACLPERTKKFATTLVWL